MPYPRKHDWDQLERDYLNGLYRSLKEMAEKTGVPYRGLQKRSGTHDWNKKRKNFNKKVNDRILKDMEKEAVSEAKKARQQLHGVANLLLNQGTQRFINPKTGKPYKQAIKNMQTAITALSSGARIKMALYDIKEGGDGSGDTNVFNFANGDQEISFRGISDAELEQVHQELARRFGLAGVPTDKRGAVKKAKGKRTSR